jgi:hypothetical protein
MSPKPWLNDDGTELVVLTVQMPAAMGNALRERARVAERSVAAEIRIAIAKHIKPEPASNQTLAPVGEVTPTRHAEALAMRDDHWRSVGHDAAHLLDPVTCVHSRGFDDTLDGVGIGCSDCGWLSAWGRIA